jgi:hypothetical protein
MPFSLLQNDVFTVRVACHTPNQVGINTLYYRVTDVAAGNLPASEVAEFFTTRFKPLWRECLSSNATFRGTSVQRVEPQPKSIPVPFVNPDPGLFLGDKLPGQVSGIITTQTIFAGRRFRGRLYIPFPSEDANSATGLVHPNYVTALDDLADGLGPQIFIVTPSGSGTVRHVLYHRDADSYTDIASYVARDRWATQRRRGHYGALNQPPF